MNTIIMLILTVLTFSPLLFVGEETPNEGLTAIIKLYETKDFDTLVRERYAELHKAKYEAEVVVLIEKFYKFSFWNFLKVLST